MLGERAWNPDGSRGQFEFLSYGQVAQRVTNLGSGLRALLGRDADHPHVAIMAKDRIEWMVTDLATACYSLVGVPIYDSVCFTEHDSPAAFLPRYGT